MTELNNLSIKCSIIFCCEGCIFYMSLSYEWVVILSEQYLKIIIFMSLKEITLLHFVVNKDIAIVVPKKCVDCTLACW